MVVLKALGGVALLGFLSSASAEQGAEPSASIGKTPQSLRETPHSITVVARERIDQQALTSFMLTLRTQF